MSLAGKIGLVFGVASKHSIAAAIAQSWASAGAQVAFAVQSERYKPAVAQLTSSWSSPPKAVVTCDVSSDDSINDAFQELQQGAEVQKLDMVAHCIAHAPGGAMKRPLVECSREEFQVAHDTSAYSLVAIARAALPLLQKPHTSSIVALSYIGSQLVVPQYSVMGPAKASLEACAKYLAVDLGEHNIRVNCISAGPINTISARGIRGFTDLRESVAQQSPLKRGVEASDVGDMAAFLASDAAQTVTGQTLYVDGGFSAIASVAS